MVAPLPAVCVPSWYFSCLTLCLLPVASSHLESSRRPSGRVWGRSCCWGPGSSRAGVRGERGGCQPGGCVGLLLVFLPCLVRNAMFAFLGLWLQPHSCTGSQRRGVLFMPPGYMLSAPHQRCVWCVACAIPGHTWWPAGMQEVESGCVCRWHSGFRLLACGEAGAESLLNNPRNAAGELSSTVTPGACPSSNVSFIAAAK